MASLGPPPAEGYAIEATKQASVSRLGVWQIALAVFLGNLLSALVISMVYGALTAR